MKPVALWDVVPNNMAVVVLSDQIQHMLMKNKAVEPPMISVTVAGNVAVPGNQLKTVAVVNIENIHVKETAHWKSPNAMKFSCLY